MAAVPEVPNMLAERPEVGMERKVRAAATGVPEQKGLWVEEKMSHKSGEGRHWYSSYPRRMEVCRNADVVERRPLRDPSPGQETSWLRFRLECLLEMITWRPLAVRFRLRVLAKDHPWLPPDCQEANIPWISLGPPSPEFLHGKVMAGSQKCAQQGCLHDHSMAASRPQQLQLGHLMLIARKWRCCQDCSLFRRSSVCGGLSLLHHRTRQPCHRLASENTIAGCCFQLLLR